MRYLLLVTLVICFFLPSLTKAQAKDERGLSLTKNEKSAGLPGTQSSWPTSGKRFALVIGVDNYQDKQITTLGGASNDAKALSDALVRYAGFPADQVILLASDQPEERQPTRGNIIRRLSNMRAVVPKDGLLLISFAGHGMERGGKAFLLPADAQVSGDVTVLEDTAINVQNMKERIQQTGVGQVVLLLDACRNDPSGRADAPNPLTESFTRGLNFDTRNSDISAFATIYATDVGDRAYEYTEKKQGYFTWAIVEGLKGAAANDKGEVTLQGLKKYIEDIVPKRVALDLGEGKRQRPYAVVEGYKADELVISVRVGPSETALDLEFWNSIKGSDKADDFRAYLNRFPNGAFAALAVSRLESMGLSAAGVPTYEFKTVFLSDSGSVLEERKLRARYLTEDLGNGVKLEMVEIPAGSFSMGSAAVNKGMAGRFYEDNELPRHDVSVPAFYMGKFEITQAQWRAVAKMPKVNIDLNPDPSFFKFDRRPVEQVTWAEAMEFCARLSKHTGKEYRLPTEAEWEYACRAGVNGPYGLGEGLLFDMVNCRAFTVYYKGPERDRLSRGETLPVGSLNVANPFGLFDMHGNVWEWVLDAYHENYEGAPKDGSAWGKASDNNIGIVRGGSLNCTLEAVRAAVRGKTAADRKENDYGLRVVLMPTKK